VADSGAFASALVESPLALDQGTSFVEQAQAAPAPTVYWYYCTEPAGYFPYVQNCNRAWVPVLPQSVSQEAG
jgi:hypothetical protein